MSKSVSRLLEQFVPGNYNLEISLNPESRTFSGTVIIKGKKVGRPSQRITLHQKGLNISETSIIKHDKNGQNQLNIIRTNAHKSYNEFRIHTEGTIYPGNYTISLSFSGRITDQMPFEATGQVKGSWTCTFAP